jgi:CheY-like chemotaxis protein
MHILLVEDNLVIQKIEKSILEKAGYQVDIAGNGQIALEMLNTMRADLILMDMQMPVMEATKALRAKGLRTPIVAITGNDTPEDRQACKQVGMNGFLAKPIKMDLFNAELKRIFG